MGMSMSMGRICRVGIFIKAWIWGDIRWRRFLDLGRDGAFFLMLFTLSRSLLSDVFLRFLRDGTEIHVYVHIACAMDSFLPILVRFLLRFGLRFELFHPESCY